MQIKILPTHNYLQGFKLLALQCYRLAIFARSEAYAQKRMPENRIQNWLQISGPDIIVK